MNKRLYAIKYNYSVIAFAITVYIGCIVYEAFCVIALVCLITASAILFAIISFMLIRCRSPPVDSKRKILN